MALRLLEDVSEAPSAPSRGGKLRLLEEEGPKTGVARKAGRVAMQFGKGLAEQAALPYELAVAPLASKEAQHAEYRKNVFEDIERLQEQKATGVWDEQDEGLLQHLTEQIKHPEKAEQFVKTADISVGKGIEKGMEAAGVEAKPEGMLEKAAGWAGFIKDPKKLINLTRGSLKNLTPQNARKIIQSLAPSKTEALRGVGAGAAMQAAEDGDLGPIGTMAATLVGDLAGGGISALSKKGLEIAKAPKKFAAKQFAKFTSNETKEIQKQLIQDFRDAGLQADIGTITDSNLLNMMQAKISQSGLTGKSLDEFKRNLSDDIIGKYKQMADELGAVRFSSAQEAGEVLKDSVKTIRDKEKGEIRNLYKRATEAVEDVEKAVVHPDRLVNAIKRLEAELKPGALKAGEQKAVLNYMEDLKKDVMDAQGNLKLSPVKNLINDKIALNDIINFETQTGQKQLLKGLVNEIDKTIEQYGRQNPGFVKDYQLANKRYAQHAKDFHNDNVNKILFKTDPMQAVHKMNTVQGIRDVKKVLDKTPDGKQLFGELKRFKLEQVIGDKMADSATNQIKLGTFANLTAKGKNREILMEILGKEGFAGLERLQKNAGKLASSAQKYYNASKSGVHAADAALMAKALIDIGSLASGNVWPLLSSGAIYGGVKAFAHLLSDKKFLRMVEDAILASEKNNVGKMKQIYDSLRDPLLKAMAKTAIEPEGQEEI